VVSEESPIEEDVIDAQLKESLTLVKKLLMTLWKGGLESNQLG